MRKQTLGVGAGPTETTHLVLALVWANIGQHWGNGVRIWPTRRRRHARTRQTVDLVHQAFDLPVLCLSRQLLEVRCLDFELGLESIR